MSTTGEPGHGRVILTGRDLTSAQVVLVARGSNGGFPQVVLSDERRAHMTRMRDAAERKITDGEIMYGVNTGCGSNRDRVISSEDLARYQVKYVKTHACGSGEPIHTEVVRAMMLLRVNSFAVGNSAMTLELCDLLLDLLNRNIVPAVPEFGSVGASGDLVPLAHIGTILIGVSGAQVYYHGELRDALEVFEGEGLQHHTLRAKEAMGLTNGSTFMLSIATLALNDAKGLLDLANLDVALHMEAIRGEGNAFDARIHEARGQQGQIWVASQVRALLEGSQRTTRAAQAVNFPFESSSCMPDGSKGPRVQDAYSVRVAPQAHGAAADSLIFFEAVVQRELNAATDNPLVFEKEDGGFDVLSGGNFHGDPLAIPLDTLAIALAKLGSIVERRLYRLLNPAFNSGLPANLSGTDASDDTGFMIVQYSQASRVMHNMGLAAGCSTLNIPTSMGQEDYVSNGANSAWVIRKSLGNLRTILAMSLLADCQAVDLGSRYLEEGMLWLGAGTQRAHDLIREHVPMMEEDRFLYPDIQTVRRLIMDGSLIAALRGDD